MNILGRVNMFMPFGLKGEFWQGFDKIFSALRYRY
jgi:hypothetical protein